VTEPTAELLVDRLHPREVAVSPDGRLVAFVAAPVGRREEHPESAVWLARSDAAGAARPFTSGTAEDKAPRFAPDGSTLYFLSDRGEREVAQLYRVPLDGGEADRGIRAARRRGACRARVGRRAVGRGRAARARA
jgi:Tol biopolymer transport system component